jgi:hypothetical protein
MFDELNFDNLPECNQEAFVQFEKSVRLVYEEKLGEDRELYTDRNGNYNGSYTPERSYATAITAYIDEYNLDMELPDVIEVHNSNFESYFRSFQSKVLYFVMRFSLRKNRVENSSIGTVISIASEYKLEIGKLLETIRKIVNQEITDTNKKDKIFSKIASLQSEIERENTTVDAIFGRMIDLSSTIGECADKLEPAISKLERIKKILCNSSKKVELLPAQKTQKLISQKEQEQEIDDEMPY